MEKNFKIICSKILFYLENLIFFFGPTGMFFIFFLHLGSYRFFYFFCFLYIPMWLYCSKHKLSLSELVILFSILIVTWFSSVYALFKYENYTEIPINFNPLIRFIILANLFICFYLISKNISHYGFQRFLELIKLSSYGFISVCLLGFIIYFAVIFKLLSAKYWDLISFLPQKGYGFLRFSPGTYPNEFGILSSFFSCVFILIYTTEHKRIYIFLLYLSVISLILTTTRAAYIAFILSLIYIYLFNLTKKRFLKYICIIFISLTLIIFLLYIFLLNTFHINLLTVFKIAIHSIINRTGSTEARIEALNKGIEILQNNLLFGVGFESPEISMLHNLFFQLLTGYGLIPLLIVSIFFYFLFKTNRFNLKNNFFIKGDLPSTALYNYYNSKKIFLKIKNVLIIHFLVFGLTNHNQSHFLTWVLFAMLLLKNQFFIRKSVNYAFSIRPSHA